MADPLHSGEFFKEHSREYKQGDRSSKEKPVDPAPPDDPHAGQEETPPENSSEAGEVGPESTNDAKTGGDTSNPFASNSEAHRAPDGDSGAGKNS